MKKLVVLFLVVLAVGCTDADMKQWSSVGNPAQITCYSGGHVIYDGMSTGKISTEKQSDGWYFKEAQTGKLIRISGDCIIKN